MSTLLTALVILAALVWISPPLAFVAWWLLDRGREQTWADERPSFDDEPTPIFDQLCFEAWEREAS